MSLFKSEGFKKFANDWGRAADSLYRGGKRRFEDEEEEDDLLSLFGRKKKKKKLDDGLGSGGRWKGML